MSELLESKIVNGVELLGHNIRIYDELEESLRENNKTSLMHMTSGGKTYIACALMGNYNNILILTPKNCINDEWLKNDYISQNATVMTYQSLLYDIDSKLSLDYDLIVYDEFHHIGAEKWQKVIEHIQDKYSNAHHVGISATPYRYLDNVRSMSDELFDGNLIEGLTLLDAIEKEVITPPVYIAGGYIFNEEKSKNIITALNRNFRLIPNSRYNKVIKSLNTFFSLEHNKDLMSEIIKKYIDEYRDISKCLKFIVFVPNVEQCTTLGDAIKDWFKIAYPNKCIELYHINSYLKKDELKDNIDKFKTDKNPNNINIAISVDMISEGVHYPKVDGVFMMRRTMSPNLYYQQIGRCINPKSKDRALIFDFMDNYSGVGNIESNCLRYRDDSAKTFINGIFVKTQNGYNVSNLNYKNASDIRIDLNDEDCSEELQNGELDYVLNNYLSEDRLSKNQNNGKYIPYEDDGLDSISKIKFVDIALDIKTLLEDLNSELFFNIENTINRLEDRYKQGKSVLIINDDDLLMSLKRRLSRGISESGLILTNEQKTRLENIGLVFGKGGLTDTRLINIQRTLDLIDRYKENKNSLTDLEVKKMNNGKVAIRKALNKGSLPKEIESELEKYGFKVSKSLKDSRLDNLNRILNKIRTGKSPTKKELESINTLNKLYNTLDDDLKFILDKINNGDVTYESYELTIILNKLKDNYKKTTSFSESDDMSYLLKYFYSQIKEIGVDGVAKLYNYEGDLNKELAKIGFGVNSSNKIGVDKALKWDTNIKMLEADYNSKGYIDTDIEDIDKFYYKLRRRYSNHKCGAKLLPDYVVEAIEENKFPINSKDNLFSKQCNLIKTELDSKGGTLEYFKEMYKSKKWVSTTASKVKDNSLNYFEIKALDRFKLMDYFKKL